MMKMNLSTFAFLFAIICCGDVFFSSTVNAVWVCKDLPNTDCPGWAAQGSCKSQKATMKRYCPVTCDLCTPPAPPIPKTPACAKTTYGCCWDNSTVAKGPTENLGLSQCRPCLDRRGKTFCNNFKSDCDSNIIGQGDVMREECPITCNVPCDTNLNIHKCKNKSEHCVSWYQEGRCSSNKEQMNVYCPYICGFC